MADNYTGSLKWFNEQKGYGFIKPDDGSKDVFIHITEIQKSGLQDIKEDDNISYSLQERDGKSSACDLEKI